MYGVPEPAPGLLPAYSTLRFASSSVSSREIFGNHTPPSPLPPVPPEPIY